MKHRGIQLREITAFGKPLAKNAGKFSGAPQRQPSVAAEPGDLIMLGDFNIFTK